MKNTYSAYADACIEGLQQWYNWDTGLWNSAGWWNGANALEAVIDYATFTRTDHYDNVIAKTFEKNRHVNPLNNRGNFLRDNYDDQLWFTLTWIKAHDLTHRKDYLDMAATIFHDVKTHACDDICGGGVWWNRMKTYKNAITNELFFTAAARLYTRTSDEQYLSLANREWKWLLGSGLINGQDLVYDRLGEGNCDIGDKITWTYNQGVILGGLAEMYVITNDIGYLLKAQSIAYATIRTLVDADDILTEQSSVPDDDADAAQFKGIFIRNLAHFVHVLVHAYGTLSSISAPYKQFITKNADALWERNRINNNKFGLNWAARAHITNAATQTSALDAFNAAMAVYRL
jgi:predicted alpha-1,6-mannanase (GH76 family)